MMSISILEEAALLQDSAVSQAHMVSSAYTSYQRTAHPLVWVGLGSWTSR
jgi:hypothetical protein